MASENSLWNQALQSLKLSHQPTPNVPDVVDIDVVLEDVLTQCKKLRDLAVVRAWKHPRENRTVLILGDVFEKILHNVQLGRPMIVAAAKAGSDSHTISFAAVQPSFWNAVRTLLQSVATNIHTFAHVAEGCDHVISIMIQYCALSTLSTTGRSDLAFQFILLIKQTILSSCETIARYLELVQQFVVLKGSRSMTQNDLVHHAMKATSVLAHIEEGNSKVSKLYSSFKQEHTSQSNEDLQTTLHDLYDKLQLPIKRTAADVWQIEDDLDPDSRQDLLNWLSTIPYANHLELESSDILEGTGDWLLNHPKFQNWQNSSASEIFWLSGIPGSGKSKLTANVAQYVLDQHSPEKKHQLPFAYVACSQKGDDRRQSEPLEILLLILRQLSGRSPEVPLRGDVVEEYKKRKEMASGMSGQSVARLQLSQALTCILSITQAAPAIIVLDALDEVDNVGRSVVMESLIKVMSESDHVVKIFVSTRPNPDIVSALQPFVSIQNVEDFNHGDIRSFLEHELDRMTEKRQLLDGQVSSSLRGEIVESLTSKAQGMFRWVELSLNVLSNPLQIRTEDEARESLGTLPSGLEAQYKLIYNEILHGISNQANLANRLFAWLLAARRPMTTAEYVAAVSVDQNGNFHEGVDLKLLLSVTRGLIREVPLANSTSQKTLQVVHLSVREFLEGVAGLSTNLINEVVLLRCLHESREKSASHGSLMFGRLKQYTKYLFEHASLTSLVHVNSKIADAMIEFLWKHDYSESNTYAEWLQLFESHAADYEFKQLDDIDIDDRLFTRMFDWGNADIPAINFVCKFGLLAVVNKLPDQQIAPWTYDEQRHSTSPLYEATSNGKYETAQWMLKRNIYPADEGRRHASALYRAAWDGNEEMVKLLLAHGANPLGGASGKSGFPATPLCMGFAEPLARASLRNKNESTDKTVTIMALIDHIEQPEYIASGHLSNLLFDWKAETLYQALQKNQEQVVARLLDRNTQLDYRTSASASGVNQIVFWWNRRCFIRTSHYPPKPIQSSLLQAAVLGANTSIVEKMLAGHSIRNVGEGAERDESSSKLALSQHDSEEQKLGANNEKDQQNSTLDARDGIGRSALHYLMDRNEPGTIQIFEMLRRAGASMNAVSDEGMTALHVAVAIGAFDSVQSLLEQNHDVDATDTAGANALHFTALGDASETVIESLLELLISRGLKLTSGDSNGNTPIHYAAGSLNLAFLRVADKLLSKQRDNIHLHEKLSSEDAERDPASWSAESAASNPEQNDYAKTALAHLCNDEGQTPLHLLGRANSRAQTRDSPEIEPKDREVARFLISIGANVNQPDKKGRCPMMSMTGRNCTSREAINVLWIAGADPKSADDQGRTLMHHAARYSTAFDSSKIKDMVERGVAISTLDVHGDTPLHHAACSYLNIQSVGLLVRLGANANAISNIGATPLHYANSDRMIEMLVRKGASLEIKDAKGRTPLLVVLEKNSCYEHLGELWVDHDDLNDVRVKRTLVACLLERGADPTVEDTCGRSASIYADELGDQDIKDKIAAAVQEWKSKGQ